MAASTLRILARGIVRRADCGSRARAVAYTVLRTARGRGSGLRALLCELPVAGLLHTGLVMAEGSSSGPDFTRSTLPPHKSRVQSAYRSFCTKGRPIGLLLSLNTKQGPYPVLCKLRYGAFVDRTLSNNISVNYPRVTHGRNHVRIMRV